MQDPKQEPATKQDLIDLEERLTKSLSSSLTESLSSSLTESLSSSLTESLTKSLAESITDKVQEMVRDSQTEVLRGFERYASSQDIRMRKLEADYSNLNTSESLRIAMLEERVTLIEQKLLLGHSPDRPQ